VSADDLTLVGKRGHHEALYDERERDQRNHGAEEIRGKRRAIEPLREDRVSMMRGFLHDFTPACLRGVASLVIVLPPTALKRFRQVSLARSERLKKP